MGISVSISKNSSLKAMKKIPKVSILTKLDRHEVKTDPRSTSESGSTRENLFGKGSKMEPSELTSSPHYGLSFYYYLLCFYSLYSFLKNIIKCPLKTSYKTKHMITGKKNHLGLI